MVGWIRLVLLLCIPTAVWVLGWFERWRWVVLLPAYSGLGCACSSTLMCTIARFIQRLPPLPRHISASPVPPVFGTPKLRNALLQPQNHERSEAETAFVASFRG